MSWQNISGNDMRPMWVSSLTDQAGLPFWLMGTILLRAPISASDFWDAEDMMRGGRENDGEKKRCVQYLNTRFYLDFFFFWSLLPFFQLNASFCDGGVEVPLK